MNPQQIDHLTNPPSYDFAYRLPVTGKWHIHRNMDKWQVEKLVDFMIDLNRPFTVRDNRSGDMVRVTEEQLQRGLARGLLLHLFYNRLSDRNGLSADES